MKHIDGWLYQRLVNILVILLFRLTYFELEKLYVNLLTLFSLLSYDRLDGVLLWVF